MLNSLLLVPLGTLLAFKELVSAAEPTLGFELSCPLFGCSLLALLGVLFVLEELSPAAEPTFDSELSPVPLFCFLLGPPGIIFVAAVFISCRGLFLELDGFILLPYFSSLVA